MEYSIEIATDPNATSQEVGDLLEAIATIALESQGYQVTSQVRLVSSEIDLYCKHKISGERVYVECKAYRDKKISGAQLRQLLGTIQFEKFSAGWLFSTSPLTKDAKGFIETWNKRQEFERRTLRIYSPENLIQLLTDTFVIKDTSKIPISNTSLGYCIKKWILIVTTFGNYWAAIIEQPGISKHVVCFDAYNGNPISDAVIDKISKTNTSIKELEIKSISLPISAAQMHRSFQEDISYRELFIDPSIEKLIFKARSMQEVIYFDIQPIEVFNRKGFSATLELEGIGSYSGLGSDIPAAIRSISTSMPLPQNVEKVLSEIAETSDPRNIVAGILNLYVRKKKYLAWSDLATDVLEDILQIELSDEIDDEQAVRSAVVIAAELLSLRAIADDDLSEFAIWVEDEDGNQWIGEIELGTPDPVVKRIEYRGKHNI